ncbi:tRNA 2-thiouridine(34) synthase MnmA [bacterium (Candidatus Torokbacteria) CG09_land_8_20_14_0_10_42_11]|nr:MAG: tRNA 2-thiouridine(34) synthase MnmA [bacterium (Candidatus Torokbacteria) CG09_land_8_20_14_0_10_42_11]
MSEVKNKKVLVLLSGGVDSAVAAALLAKKGYSVTGVFMIFSSASQSLAEKENKCCSLEAQESARRVASCLKIPFYTMNLAREFREKVIRYFLQEYKNGRTPNPCVACNREIKFGVMLTRALALGFDYVGSGHYVKSEKRKVKSVKQGAGSARRKAQSVKLFQAKDQKKDQSYFLYTLTQEKLKHLLFPLGDCLKSEAREMAKEFNLPVADRKESQDLCFVGKEKTADFLKKHLAVKIGKIVEIASGKVVGEHQGLPFYTIGQRKNIGIGGIGPFYVTAFDFAENILWVSQDKNDPALFGKKLKVKNPSWIAGSAPKFPLQCRVKIRSMYKPALAVARTQNSILLVDFQKPQKAITPGQAAVFYRGREMLGGGTIC